MYHCSYMYLVYEFYNNNNNNSDKILATILVTPKLLQLAAFKYIHQRIPITVLLLTLLAGTQPVGIYIDIIQHAIHLHICNQHYTHLQIQHDVNVHNSEYDASVSNDFKWCG